MFKIVCCIIFHALHVGFVICHGRHLDMEIGINGARTVVVLQENSSILINADNIQSSVAALLFEVHTQAENLTLSQSFKASFDNSISGKNIGIVNLLKNNETEVSMWLYNFNLKNISALIKVLPLNSSGPIPGGCNMEFPTAIAPYLRLKDDHISTYLEYQHANIGSPRNIPLPLCSSSITYFNYDVYILFLKENDYSEAEFVEKIENMTNIGFIKEHATKVKSHSSHPDTRSVFYKYPNVGVIYNIVAKYTVDGLVQESAYVPIATYGCDFTTEYGCRSSGSVESKIFLFILSIFGFAIAFFGHRFFIVEAIFFGFLSFMFVGFILLAKYCSFTEITTLEISSGIGIFGGVFCAFIWLTFYSPVISLLLVGFVFGFLVSATILYSPIGNYDIFINDKNYWFILSTGMILITIVFLSLPNVLSILASSVVGSYALLLFYDDFFETRLAYIILNVVKRAVSTTINIASNDYPFQVKDIVMSTLWIVVSLLAVVIQMRRHSLELSSCLYCKKKPEENLLRHTSRFFLSRENSSDSEEGNLHHPLLRDNQSQNYDTFYR